MRTLPIFVFGLVQLGFVFSSLEQDILAVELRAGAAMVDVTPQQFPVLINGGMLSSKATSVRSNVNARAIVLDDGQERIAIVVVDSCMMPRPLLDEAKQLASQMTKIRPDRMLISATHTHTAPASMGCLGTDADPNYVPFLRLKLVEAIAAAEANLRPAQVGFGSTNAHEYTALRRWIRRPDRIADDPFGNATVRANMHAGRVWDDVTGESGPEDPELSLISIQGRDGTPLAVLANFSMHYFGDSPPVSADYFGLFCEGLRNRLQGSDTKNPAPFVGIMSHGCSGDIWRRDYKIPATSPVKDPTIDQYANGLLELAVSTYQKIDHRADVTLAMSEARLNLKYRVPDKQRLEWAQRVVEAMGDRPLKDQTEVYAREQIILHERQSTEIVVQALRVGDIGIATTPNETYALTGLKLKLQSPLPKTMVIELANGGDGYIPPPEQHLLGGYNTWPARSAGLEVMAERKITESALSQLERVAGKSRKTYRQSEGKGTHAILKLKPLAYWRMDELAGPRALDASGNQRDAIYEPGVVFFLDGPRSEFFNLNGELNRAAHFAGGRVQARLPNLQNQYTVSFSFWNGMPLDGRAVAGWMFSRGHDHGLTAASEHIGLGGKENAGKLVYQRGDGSQNNSLSVGRTPIDRWEWNRLTMVRDGMHVRIYLNGGKEPEISATLQNSASSRESLSPEFFFGGRSDNADNWEGRLDEVAVFDRVLSNDEISGL